MATFEERYRARVEWYSSEFQNLMKHLMKDRPEFAQPTAYNVAEFMNMIYTTKDKMEYIEKLEQLLDEARIAAQDALKEKVLLRQENNKLRNIIEAQQQIHKELMEGK